MALGRRKHMDMTVGSVPKNILLFAFPLLLGNLFQQLYNMVDTWVLGNFASNAAYSAVGMITPVCNILIGFFMDRIILINGFINTPCEKNHFVASHYIT